MLQASLSARLPSTLSSLPAAHFKNTGNSSKCYHDTADCKDPALNPVRAIKEIGVESGPLVNLGGAVAKYRPNTTMLVANARTCHLF